MQYGCPKGHLLGDRRCRSQVFFLYIATAWEVVLGHCMNFTYTHPSVERCHLPVLPKLSLLFCCTVCLCPVARASLFDSGFRCSLHTYHWRVLRSLARAAPLLILLPAVIFLACCPHCHLPRDLFWHCSQWSHWHIAHWPSRNLFVCYGLSCIWCLPI